MYFLPFLSFLIYFFLMVNFAIPFLLVLALNFLPLSLSVIFLFLRGFFAVFECCLYDKLFGGFFDFIFFGLEVLLYLYGFFNAFYFVDCCQLVFSRLYCVRYFECDESVGFCFHLVCFLVELDYHHLIFTNRLSRA